MIRPSLRAQQLALHLEGVARTWDACALTAPPQYPTWAADYRNYAAECRARAALLRAGKPLPPWRHANAEACMQEVS
jgi:hypothetical protein